METGEVVYEDRGVFALESFDCGNALVMLDHGYRGDASRPSAPRAIVELERGRWRRRIAPAFAHSLLGVTACGDVAAFFGADPQGVTLADCETLTARGFFAGALPLVDMEAQLVATLQAGQYAVRAFDGSRVTSFAWDWPRDGTLKPLSRGIAQDASHGITLVDLQSGERRTLVAASARWLQALTASHDGKRARGILGKRPVVFPLDPRVAPLAAAFSLSLSRERVSALFHPTQDLAVLAKRPQRVSIFPAYADGRPSAPVAHLPDGSVPVSFSHDGKVLACLRGPRLEALDVARWA